MKGERQPASVAISCKLHKPAGATNHWDDWLRRYLLKGGRQPASVAVSCKQHKPAGARNQLGD
jgi:hypothetical protein